MQHQLMKRQELKLRIQIIRTLTNKIIKIYQMKLVQQIQPVLSLRKMPFLTIFTKINRQQVRNKLFCRKASKVQQILWIVLQRLKKSWLRLLSEQLAIRILKIISHLNSWQHQLSAKNDYKLPLYKIWASIHNNFTTA